MSIPKGTDEDGFEAGDTPSFVDHLMSIPKGTDEDGFELPERTKDYTSKSVEI